MVRASAALRAADAKERIMLRNRMAALVITAFSGAAVAAPPAEKTSELSETLGVLHAVSQWATSLSEMADKRAKSDLVKSYAREMASANADKDAKLTALAQQRGVALTPPDPQTEAGKSISDRMKAEAVLLGSLEGDAFDKEYMTLVTNTQQSLINFLKERKAAAKDQDVKQLLGAIETAVQNRLKTAQDIMLKIYGNGI
jgi:predicted outer membrane protein